MPQSRSAVVNRVLIAIYAVLAFAALGRSTYELFVKFDEAPLPYSLSLLAASLYVVVTVSMIRGWKNLAVVLLALELLFVVSVGLLGILAPGLFPARTVWSGFGLGYGFFPLFMPIVGLVYLIRKR
ncbi:MAG: hypothetical protein RLZZ400_810 [Actinomycetota bacterium]|jgi:hypothetical protein